MLDKKRQEKTKLAPELEKSITEILVANGRDIEPFVKVFNYSDENIEKSSLGSLVGVFEIAEKSEDSTYIVNFLTSVAKKEYFSNSRRGSIESFEAALHKINLALAELVKDGNIAWLGKFHGAIGVLEKNNLHFSVTGKAQILLLRNGNFSEISEGIASPESNTHPIKTFVEISSGRLMIGDKVILTSPELFELLSPEDLEKNATRMDADRFAQFLRTVLINELNMAGSLIVDFSEAIPIVVQKEQKKTSTTRNVFSQETFGAQQRRESAQDELSENTHETATTEEYIDSKTGHIYVQGETNEKGPENPLLERMKLSSQDALHTLDMLFLSQKKLFRKGKKQGLILFDTLSEKSTVATRKTLRFFRKQLGRGIALGVSKISSLRPPQMPKKTMKEPEASVILEFREIKEQEQAPQAPEIIEKITVFHSEEIIENIPDEFSSIKNKETVSNEHIDTDEDNEMPLFMREKLATFYQKNGNILPQTPERIQPTNEIQKKNFDILLFAQKILRNAIASLSLFWKNVSPKVQMYSRQTSFFWKRFVSRYQSRTLVIGFFSIILLITGTVLIIRSFSTKAPAAPVVEVKETPVAPEFPLNTEKNAHLLERDTTIVTTIPDTIITSVILKDVTYIITSSYIYNVNEQKRYLLPAGNGAIKFATAMDDLTLIFVYTDKNEVFSFAPVNHVFTKNTLVLPTNTLIEDIGTYLTYLYVLDKTTSQIYRFPRTEGGFGIGTPWLKNTLTLEDTAQMAINETIFVTPNKTTLSAFFHGQFVKNLEYPTTPLSITTLFTSPEVTNVYALDATNKRVLIWNQDGVLLAQYFSKQFANAEGITANEKTNEIFLTTSNNLLSFKFNLGQ